MYPLISTDELAAQLDSGRARILDCTVGSVIHPDTGFELRSGRGDWEDGRIPGSQHVDLLAELSDQSTDLRLMMPSAEQVCDRLAGHGVSDGDQIVLYDANMNMWAARVWWMLQAAGIPHARVLDGGWKAWTAEGRPTESGPALDPDPGNLTAYPTPGAFVGRDEVLATLDSPACLIDALQPETYCGDRPDYGRPGHIPGARNVPFASLVDADTHRYLPVDQLRERFAVTGALDAPRVITYCGGGVAASSAALVLRMLGIEDVAVYDGSMMEWAADPSLPLVTGD